MRTAFAADSEAGFTAAVVAMSKSIPERLVISLCFAAAGLAKLLGLAIEVDAFRRWGFPPGFMYFIGVLELAGAAGIWMRRLDAYAALCLAVLAAGALATRLVFAEWVMALATAVLLAVTAHFTWRNRGDLFAR